MTNDKISRRQKLSMDENERQDLLPDPLVPGRFTSNGKNGSNGDRLKFLHPNMWVYHDDIVDKVLKGDYFLIKPYSGEFVATMNCSNRCGIPCSYMVPKQLEGCWDKNDFKNPIVHMQDIGFAREMVDKLKEGGLKGMTFTGGGEPFFFKDLGKIIYYTTKDKKIDGVVYTNGNSLSKKVLDEILDAEPKLIRVSMNCGTKEVYNKFHSPLNPDEAFQRCLNSIEYFAKGALENPKINFGVAYVINEINKDDIGEIAQRIKEIVERTKGGISFTIFRPAFDYYGEDQLSHSLLDHIYNEVENKVRPVLEPLGVRVNNVKVRYDALKEDTRNYAECRASGIYSELSPSGRMNICCDRNCHKDYSFGNLRNNSLYEIFESEKRKDMLDKLKQTKCSECPPACKPHLVNNQFEEIERLRKAGEIDKVKLWISELRKIPPPVMVNF